MGGFGRPTYARIEGDDPIDLAIVLDTRLPQRDLFERIGQAIADLAPSSLDPRDHVSIYAIDCSTMDYVEDVPSRSRQLKRAVDTALSTWTARRHGVKAPCSSETQLWDLLAVVTDRLSVHSGRRAVLAVTDGHSKKSKRSLLDLVSMAQIAGVSIFGLDPSWDGNLMFRSGDSLAFSNACERTGGVMLQPNASSTAKTMRQFTAMLRERYILEFPRPSNTQPGKLMMSVSIDHLNAFIRVAGDGVPIADRALMADSSTIHPLQSFTAEAATHPPDRAPAPAPAAELVQPEAVSAATQQPAQPPAALPPSASIATPTLRVATKLTVEDVTVTDSQRRPVRGLERSDFVVKEDGTPRPIQNFEEYGARKLPPQAAPLQLPANTYTNAQPQPANSSAVNILLLDSVTTGLTNRLVIAPENIQFAKQQAISYLKRMPPGTQVAILELGNGLHVVQGVTADQAILLAAMNRVSNEMVPGANRTPPSSAAEACRRMEVQSQLVVQALEQAAAFLSGIMGRKNLIWFTPGIPWLTNPSGNGECQGDYTQQLHRDYALLNEAQVVLYPVDPRGLPGSSFTTAPGPNLKESPAGPMNVPLKESATQQLAWAAALPTQNAVEQASLRDMADATGGVPYYNRNDLDAAIEDGDHNRGGLLLPLLRPTACQV
jgi:VWFA-related protein